jgi:hypothetical protein
MKDELIALLQEIRPNYGDIGSRDVDTTKRRKQLDRATELLSGIDDVVLQVAESLCDANQPSDIVGQITHLIACVRDDVLVHDGKLAARTQLAENRLKVLIGLAVKNARDEQQG